MRRRGFQLAVAMLAVCLLATSAFAQGGGASSTGVITGKVSDTSGGVLPGVTVGRATRPITAGPVSIPTPDLRPDTSVLHIVGNLCVPRGNGGEVHSHANPGRVLGGARLHLEPVIAVAVAARARRAP